MEKEFTFGLMVENMKEILLMIRNKGWESTIGMAESMKATGMMINSTEKEDTFFLMVIIGKGFGTKEKK